MPFTRKLRKYLTWGWLVVSVMVLTAMYFYRQPPTHSEIEYIPVAKPVSFTTLKSAVVTAASVALLEEKAVTLAHEKLSSLCRSPSSSQSGDGRTQIPKIIHQMYDSSMIPVQYTKYVSSWWRIYPDFTYKFWRDSDISAFIKDHYPANWSSLYHKELATELERSDIARILILNHFGGIYADLDVMAVGRADSLLRKHGLIVSTEPAHHALFLFDMKVVSSNAILASRPFHKYWCFLLTHFPSRLRSRYASQFKM